MAGLGQVLKQVVSDMRRNSYVGSWAWLLHRVTGIGLTVYLFMHIWVMSSARGGSQSFNERLAKVQTPFFHALEILLLAGVFIHALNGLRVTAVDFLLLNNKHKLFFWIGAVIFVALMVLTVASIVPRILGAVS